MLRALFAATAALAVLAPAVAQQLQRHFPANALRGTMSVVQAPEIVLNGRSAKLAPGARIRDAENLIKTPASLLGQRFAVNYTTDLSGQVADVWILRADELAYRWPETPEQAARWRFDPTTQAWSRP